MNTPSQAVRIALAASAGFPDADDRFIRALNKAGYDLAGRSRIIPYQPTRPVQVERDDVAFCASTGMRVSGSAAVVGGVS